jgi:hypothetical protein
MAPDEPTRTTESPTDANPYTPPRPIVGDTTPAQFSLLTLLLVTTLVAVCMGVTVAAPGWGLLLSALAAPALVRTMLATVKQKKAGIVLSLSQKLAVFGVSLCVMVMIGVAAVVAFEAGCWGTALVWDGVSGAPNLDSMLITSVSIGSLLALITIVWLLWLTRPRKPAAFVPPSPDPRPPTPA